MGSRERVVVTRRLPGGALDRLAAAADVELWPGHLPPPGAWILERCAAAAGLLCLLTDRVDAALMAGAPRLRVISNYAVGVDNVDVAAASARGIPVGHTPGVLAEATADLTFALLLAAARRVAEADRLVRAGGWRTWDPSLLLGADVHGATLAIVGMGAIGRAVARRAAGFAMRVLPVGRGDSLDDALRAADFVTLHVPLTAATRRLIGARELALLRPGAILVNTSRGGVVDQAALAEALARGQLGAAALDVTEVEPLPADDPLLAAPNLLVAPHIGSASRGARTKMADLAVDNCLAGLEGRPLPHCVNPEAYRGQRMQQ